MSLPGSHILKGMVALNEWNWSSVRSALPRELVNSFTFFQFIAIFYIHIFLYSIEQSFFSISTGVPSSAYSWTHIRHK